MLWMDTYTVACIASLGGICGGGIMALVQQGTNKFNMKMMEDFWNDDIKQLQSHIERLNKKISTVSVNKPVGNDNNASKNNGNKQQRHFNQRG